MCGNTQTGQVLKLAHPLLCTTCSAHGGTAYISVDFYAGDEGGATGLRGCKVLFEC